MECDRQLRRPRVFVACRDNSLVRRLHDVFGREANFEVCGEAIHAAEPLGGAINLQRDLAILELGSPPQEGFKAAKALKVIVFINCMMTFALEKGSSSGN